MATMTMAQVIGHNVRERRDSLGMTAAALGERIGDIFGKPWPRQTVYMMESGDRAMVAQEVLALSQILELPVVQLFTPPADIDGVVVGSLTVPADSLLAQASSDGSEMNRIARSIRALDKSQKALSGMVMAQYVLVTDAKQAVLGQPAVQLEEGDDIMSTLRNFDIQRADEYYEPEVEELPESEWLNNLEGEGDGDGEGK